MREVDKPMSSPVDSISDITTRRERPPTPLEIEICKELDNRESVTVKRKTKQQMRDLGMQERNCHWNVYYYLSRNKGSGASHVYGWSVWENEYLLHSVVRYKDGSMECVTPSDEGGPQRQSIEFIEDSAIEEVLLDGGRRQTLKRNGKDVPEEVRRHYVAPDAGNPTSETPAQGAPASPGKLRQMWAFMRNVFEVAHRSAMERIEAALRGGGGRRPPL